MNDARRRTYFRGACQRLRNKLGFVPTMETMFFHAVPKARRPPPWWFLVLLAAYAVLELSFNHHLVQVSSGSTFDLASMEDLEFWSRLISGLGLAFWLLRLLMRRMSSAWLAGLLSVLVGVSFMWQFQRWLVDTIVAHASEIDKRMSLYAQQLGPETMAGRVKLRGLSLVQPERLTEASRPAWQALLPAITLGLKPEDLEPVDAAARKRKTQAGLALTQALPAQLLDDAYRRTVMVPIALGVSLLFGLANLCLLLSLLLQRSAGPAAPAWRQPLVFLLIWLALLAWSLGWRADEVQTAGYRQVARPALWVEQPMLWPFVELSLRAEPAWYAPTRWMHQSLLGGYGFKRLPLPGDPS